MNRPSRQVSKVLHVIDSFDLGGAQTVLLDFARGLRDRGFEVEVAAMHGSGVFRKAFEREGLPTHSLSPSKYIPVYVWRLAGLLRRGGFSIVHFHLAGANWIGQPIASALRIPVRVAHDHCNDPGRGNNRGGLLIDTIINRLPSVIFAVSASTRDFLVERERVPSGRVRLLYNGVDTRRFCPASPDLRREAREKFGFGEGDFVLGGIGRFVPQKNFSALVEAVSRLAVKLPRLRLLLAGSGPLEESLRRQVAENLPEGRVVFAGFVEERERLFQAIDAIVIPSLFEGLPINLLEAMASGVPVLGSRVDGLAEILSDGLDSLLVPPGDVGALVRGIELLEAAPEIGRRISNGALALVRREFSAGGQTDKLAAVYRDVLSGTGRALLL